MPSPEEEEAAARNSFLTIAYTLWISMALLLAVFATVALWMSGHFIAECFAFKDAGYKIFDFRRPLHRRTGFNRNINRQVWAVYLAGSALLVIALFVIMNGFGAIHSNQNRLLWTVLLWLWNLAACIYIGFVIHLARSIQWRERSSAVALESVRLRHDEGDK